MKSLVIRRELEKNYNTCSCSDNYDKGCTKQDCKPKPRNICGDGKSKLIYWFCSMILVFENIL